MWDVGSRRAGSRGGSMGVGSCAGGRSAERPPGPADSASSNRAVGMESQLTAEVDRSHCPQVGPCSRRDCRDDPEAPLSHSCAILLSDFGTKPVKDQVNHLSTLFAK